MKRIILPLLLLLPFAAYAQQKSMSKTIADCFLDRFPDPAVIHNVGKTNIVDWQAGYDMFALEHVWKWTGDARYFNYIKRYADTCIDAEGNVPQFTPTALDHFIAGYVFLLMYEQTGEERYARAAGQVRDGFDAYPRTAGEMFIHGVNMPQVWVDGVFMGQMFLARYAKTMNRPEYYEEVVRQIRGVSALCGTPDGLMVHAWADKGKGRWDGDGKSPEVWSEGLGWIAVLLADVFDWMPEDTPGYDDVVKIAVDLCNGLKGCQDSRTGLWSQVVDKPYAEGNWNETSGSAMFTYFLQRCIDRGLVPAGEFRDVVDRAYDGLLSKAVRNTDGFYNLIDCSSIGTKRSYQEYVSQPHEISTFAALGSYMLGTGMVEWRRAHPLDSPLSDFYCTDYSGGHILRFRDGQEVWRHDAPLSNDLWVLDNGNLLFTTGNGVLELNPQGDTVFRYSSRSRIFACQRLKNGNTFIGECSEGRLLELTPKGKTVKELRIVPEGGKADDGYIRNARRLDNGHYLVSHYSGKKVVEYDGRGRIVWQAAIPGGAHSCARLKNGHTLVASADKDRNPMVVEFDRDGNVVWSLSNSDLPGEPLKFCSGFQYLPESDSFLLTNWQGHRNPRKGPHILHVSRDKRILESFGDNPAYVTVSSIFVPGRADSAH